MLWCYSPPATTERKRKIELNPFKNSVSHFAAPWRLFFILQAVGHFRQWASAPFPGTLVFKTTNLNLFHVGVFNKQKWWGAYLPPLVIYGYRKPFSFIFFKLGSCLGFCPISQGVSISLPPRGGGLFDTPPLEIKEGVVLGPMLLKVILKPIVKTQRNSTQLNSTQSNSKATSLG